MTLEEWLQSIRDYGSIRRFYEDYTGNDVYGEAVDEYLGFAAFCFADAFMVAMAEHEKHHSDVFEPNRDRIDNIRNMFVERYNEALDYTGLSNVEFTEENKNVFFHNVMCTMARDLCTLRHAEMGALMLIFEVRGISSAYSSYFTDAASEFNVLSNNLYGDDW